MQATLERPETDLRRRFDVDAYHRMAEAGILAPKDRVELIDGEIVDMAPIGSAHAGKVDRLTSLVARALADGQVQVRVQGSLRLDAHNELQPDLMLLRPKADFYESAHPTAADVLLLVEVADSSLAYHRGPKLVLYASHGVPEVWVVDLIGSAVEICREPGPGSYGERRQLQAGTATSVWVPGLAINVPALLS